jgi:hypothetical protein
LLLAPPGIIRRAVFLIDTREVPPDPDERPRRSWLLPLLDWLLPWPALIVLTIVAAAIFDGWQGLAFSWAAILLCAWRTLKAFEHVGGMRDYHQ